MFRCILAGNQSISKEFSASLVLTLVFTRSGKQCRVLYNESVLKEIYVFSEEQSLLLAFYSFIVCFRDMNMFFIGLSFQYFLT